MLCLLIVSTLAAQVFCGLISGRILGGREVDISQHPYQISLEYNNSHNCGGSLLNTNVVLTAAHCTYAFRNDLSVLTVRAGSTYAEVGKGKPVGGEVANVVKVHHHPNYSIFTLGYDVSIVILDRYFTLSKNIQTIQLIPTEFVIEPGFIGTVAGWGLTRHLGERSEVLKALDIPKIDRDECNAIYGLVKPDMTCYGTLEAEESVCSTDSGGSVVHYLDGKPYVAGVVSWRSRKCGEAGHPDVFADTQESSIYNFIVTHALL